MTTTAKTSKKTLIRRARARLRGYREDPVRFVRQEFGAEPDPWQAEILRAFPENKRQAMKACKGPGKTCVLAWMVWNFLATRRHPRIACTSISGENLRDCLWTELAMWQKRSRFLSQEFTWTKTRISHNDNPETWWASARKWSRKADPTQQEETLAGLHGDYLLFVLDEVSGIPDAVMATAESGLATGIETKLVIAGNPTQVDDPLHRACTSESNLWDVTEITGDPDDPNRSPRVNKQWALDQIEKYGRDNPWVLVNVFGKFPPAGINALIGPDEVEEALGRAVHEADYGFQAKIIGVDVARFGDDRNVIMPRQGLASFTPDILRNARTEEIAAAVAARSISMKADAIAVDGTGGYGAGVIDALHLAGFEVHEIHSSGKATDPRYYNKRAEMWFKMAGWIRGGGGLPKDPELKRELTAPTYIFHGGKFRIEEKDQIKARLGNSPDIADALGLTFAVDVMPRMDPTDPLARVRDQTTKAKTEWDPWEN